MRAILIDPFEKTVKEVVVDHDDETGLKPIYELLGCSLVQTVRLGRNLIMLVDEEGSFVRDNATFKIATNVSPYQYQNEFLGKSLIVSEHGEDFVAPNVEDDYVRKFVIFPA